MYKKLFVISMVVVGLLVVNQAEAANLFERLFKKGGQRSSTTAQQIGKKDRAVNSIDNGCIVRAIEKREAGMLSAYDVMSGKISSALMIRGKALSTSWSETERGSRVTSRNQVWKTFKDSVKLARGEYKTAIQGTWASYKADAGVCRVDVSGVEPEGLEADL